ncbi:MAG TPA: AraC family transcriptional regulator, partial [Clostridiales bacterium]|nr:AraC family transcriptional regulator [Clostridiales bacterium]
MDSRQDFTDRQTMTAGDFEYFHYRDDPHLEVKYHNHDFYEVYFFISGKVTYTIEGKSYRLRPGDLVLVNNRELHRPEVEPGQTYERIVLWIRPYFLESNSSPDTNLTTCFEGEGPLRHHLLRLDEEVLAGVRGALSRLGKACAGSGYGSRLLQESILKELLVLINRASL